MILSVIEKEMFNYNNEFLKVLTNSNEEIISVDLDSYATNLFLNNISKKIMKEIKETQNNALAKEKTVYYIPYGIITSQTTSNWLGPKIPIKIESFGRIDTQIKTTIKEYGINNVLLEISALINVNSKILIPYVSKDIVIDTEIPLVKKIMQGKIPNVYGGIYSSSSPIHSENIE